MISNEAVEAAWAESKRHDRSRASISRDEIARMFEAAAPCLMAQAWDEGFKQGGPMHDVNYDDPGAHRINPYRRAGGGE